MSKYITTIHQDSKNKKFTAKIHSADTHEVIFTTSPCDTIEQTTKQARDFFNDRAPAIPPTTTVKPLTQPKAKVKQPPPRTCCGGH